MVPGSTRPIPEFTDADFHVSSFTGDKAYCVAVAHKYGVIAVRDSNYPDGGRLYFDREEWDAFIRGVKNDEFNF